MTQQTDADLIRELQSKSKALGVYSGATWETSDLLRRAANRIEDLTRPRAHDRLADELRGIADLLTDVFPPSAAIREAAARIEELTQPAPLALSPQDAKAWKSHVEQQRDWLEAHPGAPTAVAVIAVDALLRKRVQRLTDARVCVRSVRSGACHEVELEVGGVSLSAAYRHKEYAENAAAALRTALGIGGEA